MQEKPLSIKQLLARHSLSLSPATANLALVSAGVLRDEEYVSTTGSGEIKSYLKITDEYKHLGQNKESGFHTLKTSPAYFPSKAKQLLEIIIDALSREINLAITEIEKDASK